MSRKFKICSYILFVITVLITFLIKWKHSENKVISGISGSGNLVNADFFERLSKSYLHQGHLGDDGSGETHFDVIISALELDAKSQVQNHRKINQILKDEFEKNGLHALSIKINF